MFLFVNKYYLYLKQVKTMSTPTNINYVSLGTSYVFAHR